MNASHMDNPFAPDPGVRAAFSSARREELERILQLLDSENHLALTGPRGFGKLSLVLQAASRTGRPFVRVNGRAVTSVTDLASRILTEAFRLFPFPTVRKHVASFRTPPQITLSPADDAIEAAFATGADSEQVLEDTFGLLGDLSEKKNRLIVIFDAFPAIIDLEPGLAGRLSSVLQARKGISYVFIGSNRSAMTAIFERARSPFLHFADVMRLAPVPEAESAEYLRSGLAAVASGREAFYAGEILRVTHAHPRRTEQLARFVWDSLAHEVPSDPGRVIPAAVGRIAAILDMEFDSLWAQFNRTDRSILISLAQGKPLPVGTIPTSTVYSALARLVAADHVIRTDRFEIASPFFAHWIRRLADMPLR